MICSKSGIRCTKFLYLLGLRDVIIDGFTSNFFLERLIPEFESRNHISLH